MGDIRGFADHESNAFRWETTFQISVHDRKRPVDQQRQHARRASPPGAAGNAPIGSSPIGSLHKVACVTELRPAATGSRRDPPDPTQTCGQAGSYCSVRSKRGGFTLIEVPGATVLVGVTIVRRHGRHPVAWASDVKIGDAELLEPSRLREIRRRSQTVIDPASFGGSGDFSDRSTRTSPGPSPSSPAARTTPWTRSPSP